MRRLIVLSVPLLLVASACELDGSEADADPLADADAVFEVSRPLVETEEPWGLVGASAEPNGKARVVISLDDPPEPSLTADIRTGDCSTPGTRQYLLNDVVDGHSETVVDVPLRELLDRGYLVWIGDFAEDGPLCGDFFGAEEN
jgi:hypothetical protein